MEFLDNKHFRNDASYVAYLKVYNKVEKYTCEKHKQELTKTWEKFNNVMCDVLTGKSKPEVTIKKLEQMEKNIGIFVLLLVLDFLKEYDNITLVL